MFKTIFYPVESKTKLEINKKALLKLNVLNKEIDTFGFNPLILEVDDFLYVDDSINLFSSFVIKGLYKDNALCFNNLKIRSKIDIDLKKDNEKVFLGELGCYYVNDNITYYEPHLVIKAFK